MSSTPAVAEDAPIGGDEGGHRPAAPVAPVNNADAAGAPHHPPQQQQRHQHQGGGGYYARHVSSRHTAIYFVR